MTAATIDTPAQTSNAGRLPLPALLYLLCVVLPIGFNAGPLALTSLRLLTPILILLMLLTVLGLLTASPAAPFIYALF